MQFAHLLPACCIADGPLAGYPKSWAHYVVGVDWIARHQAREQLRRRDATFMAQPGVKSDVYTNWANAHKLAAEW